MLAYHYAASDNPDKALQYLKLSGDKAARSYANWEAILFYQEAIKLLDTWPETEEGKKSKIEVHLSMLEPMGVLGFPEGSLESLREVERLAEELNDEESLMTIYHRFAFHHSFKGDTSLAMEYSLKCLDQGGEDRGVRPVGRGRIQYLHSPVPGRSTCGGGPCGSQNTGVPRGAKKEKDLYAAGMTLHAGVSGWCIAALQILEEFEEANALFERGLQLAHEAKDTWGTGFLEWEESGIFSWAGDPDNLILHAERQ